MDAIHEANDVGKSDAKAKGKEEMKGSGDEDDEVDRYRYFFRSS
jgi:hypothetical protein